MIRCNNVATEIYERETTFCIYLVQHMSQHCSEQNGTANDNTQNKEDGAYNLTGPITRIYLISFWL